MNLRRLLIVGALGTFVMSSCAEAGKFSNADQLRQDLMRLADVEGGRVGICAMASDQPMVCVNGDQKFSMQSVMKIMVAFAALRMVDEGRLRLDETVVVTRNDLSVNIQPIAAIVDREGKFETTVEDLIVRAVIESDSAATDILIAKLGGPAGVQQILADAGISGIHIDRNERDLQTQTAGLTWHPDYVYPAKFAEARGKVSDEVKHAAFSAYLEDERDTATPEAMTRFLADLAGGKLLSPGSTRMPIEIMYKTKTFPNRLRAGTPEGWKIGHKTGTSATVGGVNGVTNDVGVIQAPDGSYIAISVFVSSSPEPAEKRAAIIAEAARLVTKAYSQDSDF